VMSDLTSGIIPGIDPKLLAGQKKLTYNFVATFLPGDIEYVGSFPGYGWKLSVLKLHDKSLKIKSIRCWDPKEDEFSDFNRYFINQCLERDILISFTGGFTLSSMLDVKENSVLIWDVRVDYESDSQYENELNKELRLKNSVVRHSRFSFLRLAEFKVRVGEDWALAYPINIFPQVEYFERGKTNEYRMTILPKFKAKEQHINWELVQEMSAGLQDSNSIEGSLIFKRCFHLNYTELGIVNSRLLALNTFSNSINSKESISRLIDENFVICNMILGDRNYKYQNYEDYSVNSFYAIKRNSIGTSIQGMFRFLEMPFRYFTDFGEVRNWAPSAKSWLFLIKMPRTDRISTWLVKEASMMSDTRYIKRVYDMTWFLSYSLERVVQNTRRKISKELGLIDLKDLDSIEDKTKDVNLTSISGHAWKLVVISQHMPVNFVAYFLLIRANLLKHRALNSYESGMYGGFLTRNAMKRLYSNILSTEYRPDLLWHSAIEWKLGFELGSRIIEDDLGYYIRKFIGDDKKLGYEVEDILGDGRNSRVISTWKAKPNSERVYIPK
jgi:hypothetical protein